MNLFLHKFQRHLKRCVVIQFKYIFWHFKGIFYFCTFLCISLGYFHSFNLCMRTRDKQREREIDAKIYNFCLGKYALIGIICNLHKRRVVCILCISFKFPFRFGFHLHNFKILHSLLTLFIFLLAEN